MTRRGILLAYRILGPLGLVACFLGLLDELNLIDLSERALPELIFGILTSAMYLLAFAIPVLVVTCPIIVVRYRHDRLIMLPALLMFAALAALFAPLLFGIEEPILWPGGLLLLASVLAATWAGYFAPPAATAS